MKFTRKSVISNKNTTEFHLSQIDEEKTAMAALCTECFDDHHFKLIVSGMPSRLCSECEQDSSPAITAEDIAEIMVPLLQQRLTYGRTIRRFASDEDDRGWDEPQGEELDYFLRDILGDHDGFLPDLLETLSELEPYDHSDPDSGFFDGDRLYEWRTVRPVDMLGQWDTASQQIQNRHRYFSPAAIELFDSLFGGLDDLCVYRDGEQTVISTLPEGTKVYRARDCSNQSLIEAALREPMGQVGPPPAGIAGPGRMNASGVSVLYAAQDLETAVSEIRPAIGSTSAVIQLMTTRPLKVLDFHLLEEAFQGISFFDSDYDRLSERLVFIRRLHDLISRPVHPKHAHEYMITQAMAEYLAYIHPEKVDGILFKSVQREGGVNVVLFPNAHGETLGDYGQLGIPIEYVIDSLEFMKAKKVQYFLETCFEYSAGAIASDFAEDFEPC